LVPLLAPYHFLYFPRSVMFLPFRRNLVPLFIWPASFSQLLKKYNWFWDVLCIDIGILFCVSLVCGCNYENLPYLDNSIKIIVYDWCLQVYLHVKKKEVTSLVLKGIRWNMLTHIIQEYVTAEWLALLLHIREVLCSNFELGTCYSVWGFCGFPKSLQTYAGMAA
jgi:hypothetical protein